MRLVCLSDTHGLHDRIDVPDGDVLIHAGDLTRTGDLADVRAFARWLSSLPHPHKVVIAGNHDFVFEKQPQLARQALGDVIYLEDELAVVAGLRVWGSPWQPRFFDWAFNLDRGPPLKAVWDRIPPAVDVLVTHGPPRGHGDRSVGGEDVGCDDLRDAVARLRPRLHVFGHIHEGYGRTEADGTVFLNASTCDVRYRPVQVPWVVDLPAREGGASPPG